MSLLLALQNRTQNAGGKTTGIPVSKKVNTDAVERIKKDEEEIVHMIKTFLQCQN